MLVFGPVPSRRLGRSLGINNIPPKTCTYSCIYCQIGRTSNMTFKRASFYNPGIIFNEVRKKINKLKRNGNKIDYLTFVPDGEPTLDINLKETIKKLKVFNIPIAVITNSSLINDTDVQNALLDADLVSVKIDTINYDTWKKIDRPCGNLDLNKILDGIIKFSQRYKKTLITETMIVKDINDNQEEAEKISDFLLKINNLKKEYILIPTRPPAENQIQKPSEESILKIYNIFKNKKIETQIIASYEGDDFALSQDIEKEILSTISVHPMKETTLIKLIKKANCNVKILDKMVKEGKISEVYYENEKFYLRRFK